MKNELKIGYVVADADEYAPLLDMAEELSATRADVFKREGHVFSFEKDGKRITVHAVLCGIGTGLYLARITCELLISLVT